MILRWLAERRIRKEAMARFDKVWETEQVARKLAEDRATSEGREVTKDDLNKARVELGLNPWT